MTITVAICTWNRAALLDRTLTRLQALKVPGGVRWEVVVVDNNSTDDTPAVLAKHAKLQTIPLKPLHEPAQGLSRARNCAVDHATGELILWTDDDVLVDEQWLAEYVRAAKAHPNATYFGGRIDPWYEVPPPAWVTAHLNKLQGLLVVRDLPGESDRPFEPSEQPFGANMAFRTDALRKHQFDPNLGRCGTEPILGDETALFAAVKASGGFGVWVPAAKVQHFIPAARMTLKYLWTYFYGHGRTEIRVNGMPAKDVAFFRGAPRWWYRQVARDWLKATACRFAGKNTWLPDYVAAAEYTGRIAECRRISEGR